MLLIKRLHIIRHVRKFNSYDEGIKDWKINSGYHKRSLIESFMFRLKQCFGFNLHHKKKNSRVNEIITKINMLNLMAYLGMPKY